MESVHPAPPKILGTHSTWCNHVVGTEMIPQKKKYIQESEEHIVNHVRNRIDTPPHSYPKTNWMDPHPPPLSNGLISTVSLPKRKKAMSIYWTHIFQTCKNVLIKVYKEYFNIY